jgi:creatinine amidohydrolase
MRMILPAVFVVALAGASAQQQPGAAAASKGTRLEDLTWSAAEQRLRPETVVVLPIGAAAQEHGPHLKLGNDLKLTEYLVRRLIDGSDIVAAPTLPYHHYPAFAEYPGSTSLALATARDFTADIARSLTRYGPRRFYVLNPGAATTQALAESARVLAAEGILLRYTDARARLDTAVRRTQPQVTGSHADEIETSMMLYIDPASVDMPQAVREYGAPSTPFRLTRREGTSATYSATGVWGDATLATREKGRDLVGALVSTLRAEIEETRKAPLPVATTVPAPEGRPTARGQGRSERFGRRPDECLAGDDRAIRLIAPAFYLAWANQDAIKISSFWAPEGDMVHPDGFIEGSAQAIRENRTSLFMRPEYKSSRHSLTFGQIRCITGDVAVADAKWDLRGVTDAKGQTVPPIEGLCTLVLKKGDGGWHIEAYRYSMHPQHAGRPTLLQRPGTPESAR